MRTWSSVLFAVLFPPLMVFANAPLFEADMEAKTCQNVDFSSQLGPVRNQGDANWCFAYAAADLITQKLHQRASAIASTDAYYAEKDAADVRAYEQFVDQLSRVGLDEESRRQALSDAGKILLKDQAVPFSLRSGGSIETAIEGLSHYGVCWEKDVPSDGGKHSITGSRADANLRRSVLVYERSEVESNHCPLTGGGMGPMNPQAPLMELVRKAWKQAIDDHCERYTPALPWQVETIHFKNSWNADGTVQTTPIERKRLMIAIDDALNHGKIVGISYNPDFLQGVPHGEPQSNHASSIVGRDCNRNCQCRYLLRNSWSAKCSVYRDPYRGQCNQGEIWISQSDLENYVYGTTILK